MQTAHDNLQTKLLSSISHDLKTPLASIIGALDIYQQLKNTLSEERKEALISTAIKEAIRLDSFITNILDMAKLESNIIFKFDNIDIGGLVRQCAHKMEQHLFKHKLQLELPSLLIVQLNEVWISRALTILLDNAVLYTPENTKIIVSVSSDNEFCKIIVRDYGGGVDDKIKANIFYKNSRTNHSDTKLAGTGLGLPICKLIAQMHGGDITIDTGSNGTVFNIKLPLIHE